MQGKSLLTFKDGRFILRGKTPAPSIDRVWELQEDGSYATRDFKAAAHYLSCSDARAVKILSWAFVKRYSLPAEPLPSFLDPHQKEGVAWILTRARSYLAHAPGAGKTVQALTAALRSEGRGQVLFIVPPSLTVNWVREIEKFYGYFSDGSASVAPWIEVIPDSKGKDLVTWRAEFLIIPDSMLTRAWVLEALIKTPKRFVAVDEASRFKDPLAQRTLALFGGTLKDGRISPGLVHDARHAVLLDGSPMPNRPMELWAPTYAMFPEAIDFLNRDQFGFRYCGATQNDFGQWEFKHSSREDELKKKLTKDFMHVVGEAELGHPERLRTILYMDRDARSAEHKSWETHHLMKHPLTEISEETSQGDFATFRHQLGMLKTKWIAQYVADRLERKAESILLFAWHRDVCQELAYSLKKWKPVLVIGGTDEKEREKGFELFQAGKRKLIIGNIAAMGRGHNLQKADRVIFGEYSWCGETNLQAEKRASRKGSEKTVVRCEYIVSPGSMDEIILKAVFRKDERVKKVIG